MQTGCEIDRQTYHICRRDVRQTDHICRLDVRQTDRQIIYADVVEETDRRAEAGRQIKTDLPKSLKESKNASCFKETQVHF